MTTFGVEIEVSHCSRMKALEVLRSSEIPARISEFGSGPEKFWKIVQDGSTMYGCEIVSPILEGQDGLAEVSNVASVLRAARIGADTSCGLHVHVGAKDLEVEEIRHVVKRYMKFERTIDKFVTRARRFSHSQYAVSNLSTTQRYPAIDDNLRYANSVGELAFVFGSRRMKVNLEALVKHGTIEFRHHQGTTNPRKIRMWTRFCLEFVAASAAISRGATPIGIASYIGPECPNGKLGSILSLISTGHASAEDVASQLGWSVPSVRAAIRKLRRKGFTIVLTRRIGQRTSLYHCQPGGATETVRTAADPFADDHVFAGISPDIERYLRHRACSHFGFEDMRAPA